MLYCVGKTVKFRKFLWIIVVYIGSVNCNLKTALEGGDSK
jgi:hypothetical protein